MFGGGGDDDDDGDDGDDIGKLTAELATAKAVGGNTALVLEASKKKTKGSLFADSEDEADDDDNNEFSKEVRWSAVIAQSCIVQPRSRPVAQSPSRAREAAWRQHRGRTVVGRRRCCCCCCRRRS